jgi:hypothetical protein
VLCVLGPRRTTGLALWACSVVLFRVKWRAVSREEHVLGSTVRASVRGGQRKLGLPAETASSAQARSNSGVGFSCPDPVNEPSTLVILGKQGWFPDVGFRKQARKPTPPVNECNTMSVDLRSPGRITIFSLGRLSSPHHFYGPPAGLLDGRPLSSASPSCAGCAVRRSQHKEEQLRLLIHHAQRAECIAEAARHRCTCVSCLLDIACYSWCRMRRIAI